MATGVGLFGKTQFRRDFLAVGVPRPLLTAWEGWLTRGMAHSRHQLGAGWVQLFLTMPIWHGALGRSVCGMAAALAVMPSMDGAGRCFPLSVLAWSDEEDASVGEEAWQGWAAAADDFLLGTLDETGSHDEVLATLGRLPPFPGAMGGDLPAVEASGSVWWTRGGERSPSDRILAHGLPNADAFTTMIGDLPAVAASLKDERHVG